MTGLEYMRTVCPTTKVGKDPLREDVMDAFEDGIAEGWKQCKEKQWKPSEELLMYVAEAIDIVEKSEKFSVVSALKELFGQLKAL